MAAKGTAGAIPITAKTLGRIELDSVQAEAADALERGERIRLVVGEREDGGRVETILLEPSGRAVQSSGAHLFRGDWNGERLVTDRGGHLLDRDGACFCRDCETARGFGVDDDE